MVSVSCWGNDCIGAERTGGQNQQDVRDRKAEQRRRCNMKVMFCKLSKRFES